MMISIEDARAFAEVLTSGADKAEKAGQTEFDLTGSLSASAKEALDNLQADLNKDG